MARIARVVVEGFPHHVVQRGNRRQPTFFCDDDYAAYLALMGEWCAKQGVEIWSYCLMSNHIHLIAVPEREDSLRSAIGEAHRRYTRRVNFREGWRGHLWQERFHSFPMDENYLLAAARYVEQNPVRAGIVSEPTAYRWSSAAAHVAGQDDCLVKVRPLLELEPDWESFLNRGLSSETLNNFRKHEQTGRPLGNQTFVNKLEKTLGRILRPLKPWETQAKE
jgi:putative transposase